MLIDLKQNDLADKYILKLPDIEDQMMTFKMMGKIKQVVDVAFNHKKYKIIEELDSNNNLDPAVRQHIQECYAKLKKK